MNEQVFIFKPQRQEVFQFTLVQMSAIDCEKHYNFMRGIWASIDQIYSHMIDSKNVQLSDLTALKQELHTLFENSGRYENFTMLL